MVVFPVLYFGDPGFVCMPVDQQFWCNFSWLLMFKSMGVRLHLWTAATNRPIVHITGDTWVRRATVEWYGQGKIEELGRKTCPSVTLSTTNPSWIDRGAKLGLRGEWPATNKCLKHSTASFHELPLYRSKCEESSRLRPFLSTPFPISYLLLIIDGCHLDTGSSYTTNKPLFLTKSFQRNFISA
jgi:hypothetical protein